MSFNDYEKDKQVTFESTHRATNDQSRIARLSGLTGALDLAFNLGGMFSLTGAYRHDIGAEVIEGIIQRHDSFRSCFERTPEGVIRHILPRDKMEFSVPYFDFSDTEVPFDEVKNIYRKNLNTHFNIFENPPFLCSVCKVAPEEHIFVLTVHHIIADFRSTVLFGLEFRHYYELKLGNLLGDFPYAAVGDAQSYSALEDKGIERYNERKEQLLTSLQGFKDIDFGKDIPLLKRTMKLMHREYDIPQDVVDAVNTKAKSLGISTTAIYTAAAQLFVNAVSGQNKFVIGLPVDVRPGKFHKGAMGYLSRPMPIRFDAEQHASLSELVVDVGKQIKTALKWRFFPIGDLYTSTAKQGDRPPRIQVLFNHLRAVDLNATHHNMHLAAVYGEFTHSDMDMWITVQERQSAASVKIEYGQDIFDETAVDKSSPKFLQMLDIICGDDDAYLESLVESEGSTEEEGQSLSVHVVGSFTLDPFKKTMASLSKAKDVSIDTLLYPYQQVIQSLILPGEHKRPGGMNVLLRMEDFFRNKAAVEVSEEDVSTVIDEIADAVSASVNNKSVYHQIILCPSTAANSFWVEANKRLMEKLADLSSVSVVNLEGEFDQHLFDPDAEKLAHIPYKAELYNVLARKMLSFSYCHSTIAPKVFVLDCDNTLWKGVVGEDGVEGLEITEHHKRFQEKLVSIQKRGGLLALASKNNEEEVLRVFNSRQDMPLSMEHIVSHKINWSDKSGNVRELAEELNLGLDSFVFIDDNPVEIEKMQFSAPQVLSLQIPTEAEALSAWIDNLWVLSHEFSSDFDRTRVYREEVSRKKNRSQHTDIEAFIQDLNLETSLFFVDSSNIKRASQLTQRTNQFNLTGERLNELQLQDLLDKQGFEGYVISCRDRFGDYGIIGFILFAVRDRHLVVRNLLVSCRVLGRGIEVHILNHIYSICREMGATTVSFDYKDTCRNKPGRDFLEAVGRSLHLEFSDGLQNIPVDKLVEVKVNCFFTNHTSAKNSQQSVIAVDRRKEAAFLLAACFIDDEKDKGASRVIDSSVTTTLEHLWRQSLELKATQPCGDFFESGGDSLAAVGLLVRINQTFGLDLAMEEVYENSTFTALLAFISDRLNTGLTRDTYQGKNQLYREILEDIELSYDDMPLLEGWQHTAEGTSQNTLLTGATGYVGVHILKQLLREREARVTCLIRAADSAMAKDRLRATAEQYKLSFSSEELDRIDVLAGDLGKSLLGLEDEVWNSLQDTITRVVHCGANVNFFESYNRIKQANVESTRTLIKLCATRVHKKLIYISSLGVLHGTQHIQLNEYAETVATGTPAGIPTGYQQSKWASEKLINRAVERGLNAQIVRLGTIAGNAVTNSINHSDFLTHLLVTIRKTGISPEMRDMDLVPVDFTAKAIDCIARESNNAGEVFHIANPYAASLDDVSTWARFNGNKLEVLPFDQWREKMLALFKQQPDMPLARYEPLFYEVDKQPSFIEILLTAPPVKTSYTQQFLNNHGLSFPAITPELFLGMDEVFKENGLLDRDSTKDTGDLFCVSERMSGYISPWQDISSDEDYRTAYEQGRQQSCAIDTDFTLHVGSYSELFSSKKVSLTGEVRCAMLDKAPLAVSNGFFEIAPFSGYRPKQKESLLFLVYHVELRSQQGDIYSLKGMKVNKSIENLFFEVSQLLISIERDGETLFAGMIEVPFAELFRSQLADMTFRPMLDDKGKMKSKMMWIAFLTIPFVKNYLNLYLRRNIWSWQDIKEDVDIIPFLREKRKALAKFKTVFNRLGFLSAMFKG
ncbi:hypothetical protein R50073_36680 [Maricurvus nonylphenolicus]|uniref:thioester reductase domain-containing protein n=1 Tax=Maricurvus nonylphenolicus TaxID=1008307 RepID=UPI0036F27259